MAKRRNDEYEETDNQQTDFGFEFNYGSGHLGNSKSMSSEDMSKLEASKRNKHDVPLFVKCRSCGTYMDFQEGSGTMLDGWYICPSCKTRVKEITLYNKLDKENNEWLKKNM